MRKGGVRDVHHLRIAGTGAARSALFIGAADQHQRGDGEEDNSMHGAWCEGGAAAGDHNHAVGHRSRAGYP